jgi:hypothetical protein
MIRDHELEFASGISYHLGTRFGMQSGLSTRFYPEIDGKTG